MKKLIYVTDAQCGWCYGNCNQIITLQKKFENEYVFETLVGGMWIDNYAPVGGEQLSQFLQQNAPRMSKITGVKVSSAFYQLARDSSYRFSSLEPNAAIVLMKEIVPHQVFYFIKEIQSALFIEGKRLDKLESYIPILEKLPIDKEAFKTSWLSEKNLSKTRREFEEASKFTNSFPTLLHEENGRTTIIATGYFNLDELVLRLR